MEFYSAYFTIKLTTHCGSQYTPKYSPAFSSFLPSLMLLLYQTHKIFPFHPAVAHLHGLQVTSPWKAPNPLYPSPHNELLKAHFQTSIFASLSAAAEPLDEDDDDDDEPELPEIPSNHDNEAVRVWVDDPNRYPPAEWRLDNEERDKSTAGVSNRKDVEIPPSDFRNLAVV
jgi:hypothetical protein